jgi:26S proteasome regulatory subunit N11
VVDPIQSVRGKVVIDAFRLLDQGKVLMKKEEQRQTTSNIGNIQKPSSAVFIFQFSKNAPYTLFPQARVHGLGISFYNMPIKYSKNAWEERMLMSLDKLKWTDILKTPTASQQVNTNEDNMKVLLFLSLFQEVRLIRHFF